MRVLIVEDEYFQAADLSAALRSRGVEVIGPVGTVRDAEQALAAGGIDGAALDVNLRGEMSFPIADRLEAAGVPYLIATGYSAEMLPELFRSHPRVEKPIRADIVAQKLLEMLAKAEA